jgi:hypothetical protein
VSILPFLSLCGLFSFHNSVKMPFYTASKSTFEVGGQEFPRISWWKEPGMRGLYICLMFAVLTSATNGYDGSMMNGLQALDQWVTSEYYFSDLASPVTYTFAQHSTTQARLPEDF